MGASGQRSQSSQPRTPQEAEREYQVRVLVAVEEPASNAVHAPRPWGVSRVARSLQRGRGVRGCGSGQGRLVCLAWCATRTRALRSACWRYRLSDTFKARCSCRAESGCRRSIALSSTASDPRLTLPQRSKTHLEQRVAGQAEPVRLDAIDPESNVSLTCNLEGPLQVDARRARNIRPFTARRGIRPQREAT